jgi:hypothetical protein
MQQRFLIQPVERNCRFTAFAWPGFMAIARVILAGCAAQHFFSL